MIDLSNNQINFWDSPVGIDLLGEAGEKVLIEVFAKGYSFGIQPMILYNAAELSNINHDRWPYILGIAAQAEDEFMMGAINVVDTFYKYLAVDIRPIYKKSQFLVPEKISAIVDYFHECPMCLVVDENEKQRMIEKYGADTKALQKIVTSLIRAGGIRTK